MEVCVNFAGVIFIEFIPKFLPHHVEDLLLHINKC